MADYPNINDIKQEVIISTTRSSGPGGQHVNKVETKVILRWRPDDSRVLNDVQKEIIRATGKNKLTKDGEIIISADSKRSQLKNKELAFKKLDRLLSRSFKTKKKRIKTTPGKAEKKKRLDKKRKQSEKKQLRKRIL